jgi:serine/threonine-protein kinase
VSVDETFELLLHTIDPQQRAGPPTATLRPHHSAPSPPLPALSVASRDEDLAEFVVSDTLGQGAVGEVCAAYQQSLQRQVALKRLRRDVTQTDPGGLVVEARVLGRLEHPNVVPVYALGLDPDGRPAFVMKRVEGVRWRDLIRSPGDHPDLLGGRPPLEAHVDILRQLCGALARAHSLGVLHLDVKPDNVMIGRFGEVYLVDWGVAAARKPGVIEGLAPSGGRIVGTPAYLAPEQARGEPATERTDVYLLGACLYEVLAGHPPRGDASVDAALAAAVRGDFLPLVGDSVLHVLARAAMAPHPSQRPEGPLDFARALTEGHAASLAEALVAGAEASAEAVRDHLEDGDTVGAARLMTDARRGFEAALTQAPRFRRAQEGLRGLLRTMARHELRSGAVERARALLAEDPELAEELAPLVQQAEAARVRRKESAEARRTLRDLARGSWRRAGMLAASWTAVLSVGWWMALLDHAGRIELGYPPLLLALGFLSAVGLVMLRREQGAARRRVQGNLAGFGAAMALMAVTWAAGWAAEQAIGVVLWVGGTAAGVVAVTTDPRMGLPAALVLAGAALILLLPGLEWEVAASAGTLAALVTVVGELRRSA